MSKDKASRLRKYIISCMLIVSLILIMVSLSFSWFFNNNQMQSWDITVGVEQAQNLLVKDGNNNYVKSLKIQYPEGFTLAPVCGDGKSFFEPVMTKQDPDKDGIYEYLPSEYKTLSSAEQSERILSFDVSFHVDHDVDLYLSVDPTENEAYSYVYKSDDSAESAYGSFSSGYISGAVRIAIFRLENGEYVLKNIWIPDADTQLVKNENGTLDIATGEGSVVEESYKFVSNANGDGKAIQTNGAKSGEYLDTLTGIRYTWGTDHDIPITHITNGGQNDLKVVVWIDGHDRECHNALIGGIVDLNLMFNVR